MTVMRILALLAVLVTSMMLTSVAWAEDWVCCEPPTWGGW